MAESWFRRTAGVVLMVFGSELVPTDALTAAPREERLGEKAKQMLRTGDWLTPRFAGLERLDNPPLFLWLMAAAFAVLGVNEFAAVMWSALSGVACVALTFRLARRLGLEAFEAWAAGLVLLATGYVLKYSNHAMLDVFMTALFLMALLAYRRAWEGERRAWVVLGALTGGLLARAVTGWVAVPLLLLLLLFGVLVVTATPINRVPQRLAQIRDMAIGRVGAESTVDDAEEAEEEPLPDGAQVDARHGPLPRTCFATARSCELSRRPLRCAATSEASKRILFSATTNLSTLRCSFSSSFSVTVRIGLPCA